MRIQKEININTEVGIINSEIVKVTDENAQKEMFRSVRDS